MYLAAIGLKFKIREEYLAGLLIVPYIFLQQSLHKTH